MVKLRDSSLIITKRKYELVHTLSKCKTNKRIEKFSGISQGGSLVSIRIIVRFSNIRDCQRQRARKGENYTHSVIFSTK